MDFQAQLQERIQGFVRDAGFSDCRVTDCAPLAGYRERAEKQGAGEGLSIEPLDVFPEAKSVLVLCRAYPIYEAYPADRPRISSFYYASQQAYLAERALIQRLNDAGIRAVSGRELPHKALAMRAGLGDYGRNGLIQHPAFGSRIVLSVILIDQELPAAPHGGERLAEPCRNCAACVKACPVNALRGTSEVDMTRCLRVPMYRGRVVPPHQREAMGPCLIGCDFCRDACPRNTGAREPIPEALTAPYAYETLLDDARLKARLPEIRGQIGSNYGRADLLRAQALIALGNSGQRALLPLALGLVDAEHEATREHARWAAERLRGEG